MGGYADGEYVSNVECWCRKGLNYSLEPISEPGCGYGDRPHTLEVIGNIHENSELKEITRKTFYDEEWFIKNKIEKPK